MPEIKKALITGITGSGGSYLAEYIINNHPEAEVHGISRWHSTTSNKNLESIANKVKVHECDLNDFSSVQRVLKEVNPDTIFHLAAHANVKSSWETPLSVMQNNILGTANLLEVIHINGLDPIFQMCSTSEVYGQVDPKNIPIKEECPISVNNPYAVSKLAQEQLGLVYYKRNDRSLKIITTRMFSYINPRRKDVFATSFAMQVARIEQGLQKILLHGNLDSTRTMIDVRDVTESYWLATTKGKPGEIYNIGGEQTITVGEFLDVLKKYAKCEIPSQINPKLLRPVDVTLQIPDTSKFRNETGWKQKYSFDDSVQYLLDYCREEVQKQK